jgi:hypothetical protein
MPLSGSTADRRAVDSRNKGQEEKRLDGQSEFALAPVVERTLDQELETQVLVLALPLTCVISGRSLHFSEPWIVHDIQRK